jgi:hypothetical protein
VTAEVQAALQTLGKAQTAVDGLSNTTNWTQPWSPGLVQFLAVSVLGFSCLVLAISAVLLWRARASGLQVLRVAGVISILAFSALLLVVGYDNQQLTPIIGLFGAIAGYLLGKDSPPSQGNEARHNEA